MKTCWRQLTPLDVIASKLKLKYRNAVRVVFVDNELQEKVRSKGTSRMDKKLVYLEESPDYCKPNKITGSPGMLGRTCSSEDVTTNRCKTLCQSCELKPVTVQRSKTFDCRCRFLWCCSIKCESCSRKYSETTCTSRGKKTIRVSKDL